MTNFAGITLSASERLQLGHQKPLKNRKSFHPSFLTPKTHSDYAYPPPALWPQIREFLVARSFASNPHLDATLTAYTPGETLTLLDHPRIAAWHQYISTWQAPAGFTKLVFVPCAKTKPWDAASTAKSKMYTAYHALRKYHPEILFVTISEPLGLVPMQHWGDFPQYDNPGLFRDDALRSGLTTQQWLESPFAKKYIIPFDELARSQSIARLAEVIAEFLPRHQHLPMLSLVDSADSTPSTHCEMLNLAINQSGVYFPRLPKRDLNAPRVDPLPYLRSTIENPRFL